MAQTNSQILPSKEATLFRHLVQNYETKQYKKGIKGADQILRKHPNHGDTQAMKALILSNQGKTDEAFELCRLALKNAMKSHVCWHVYGLLYRGQKNYEEAIKAYRFALRLDPESVQIQRDLALLQVHMRDYQGYVQSRRQMLQAKPGLRQNWTALAIGLHLSGDLAGAEDVLNKFEETLNQAPSKSDMEHAEAVLYKNSIIAESGDVARALEHLDTISKTALDRLAIMELRAKYVLNLDRKEEAQKAYRALLARNPEKREYYDGLEKALGLNRASKADHAKLRDMYHSYAEENQRADAPRRIPLDFEEGDNFKQLAEKYLRRMFTKGVPSAFANLKQLYSDASKKETIRSLVEDLAKEEPQANGTTGGSHKTNGHHPTVTWQLSINYFLAQHYDYYLSRDLKKAQDFIEKTISLNPSKTDYTFNMTRARIQKHLGNIGAASKEMNAAREMDLKDRYINTKCAKYQLRNNEHQAAIETMGMFTRKEAVGGPLGDLLDMQCVWFVTEDGESYFREGNLSLALKRFRSVYEMFETWTEDQFDFHTFSLRKGMVRAYVDMIRWEDDLRKHPFFTRAALSAIRIYCLLHDLPSRATDGQLNSSSELSEADKKKAAKKARKEAEKAEAERKAAAAKKPQSKADDGAEAKKEDTDPLGLELVKTQKPLEEAMKFLTPLLDLSPKNIDVQFSGFEVYIRRKNYLPALKCLLAASSIDSEHPKCHEMGIRFQHALSKVQEALPSQIKDVIESTYLSKVPKTPLAEQNEAFLARHQSSARHIQAAVRTRQALRAEESTVQSAQKLVESLQLDSITLADAEEGSRLLDEIQADAHVKSDYAEAANKRWPDAAFGVKA
ncbi:NMDA receptor-regulated protein 1 [Acrodontium crateriforme]|uniref:NMDA receptor-regulated protein 1 n=1 Tax=Acrodontium crateriforme TaxID=150365 RepID=A0AAQ3M2I6_9PEZI|nr:NMDA receptor-regulated protein 1 [Acrodontium crateriforme]